jgi:crotonobetainyl-CoA:carnitine CoA-transferase CaiB-like acyl-CoA transferase
VIDGAGSPPAARRVDFLTGMRVLELGDGVAGASGTSVLWALGADVTAVVDPSSAHRHGRPHVERDGEATSLLSIILDWGKRLLTVDGRDQLEGLLSARDGNGFDLVVVDRVRGARGALAGLGDIDAYIEFVERHAQSAWLTISAFGLTGERSADVATELTVAAAAGMLAVARDERSGQPLKLAGQQSLLNTGQAAALAACHAFDLARGDGPVHLDLSAVEATIATGPTLEVGNLMLDTRSPGGARRYGAPASFYTCTDGLIRISAMEDHQWQGVVEAMGSPTWTERFATVEARVEGADVIDEHVAAWTGGRSKVDAEAALQARGVPATALSSPTELLGSPQLAHREALDLLPVDGMRARAVGLPFRVVGGGVDAADDHEPRRRSLRGLRMLEAGRVLAVPLAGSILGALGAEVTKLEDLPRLDMYRRRGPYIDGEAGTERGAYFALVNHSKQSAAFDVDGDRARLDALLEQSDVVLENLGSKRASALGLGAASASARHGDLLAISSSGFGLDGPHSAYRAYAYNLQASCGLGFLTRSEANEPAEIDIAWADLISAYALATIIAAWTVGPSGNRGIGLDFAMSDLVVAHFNEFIAAASVGRDRDDEVDRANELSPFAPHGVYRTEDGWLALAVAGDDEFGRLVSVLDDERLATPAFATAAARSESRRALDACVGEAVRTSVARDLARELRGVGVPAEQVMSAADLLADPQLAGREFLSPVEHPVWGRRRLVGIPWRPYGGPALALAPPPLLAPQDASPG